MLRPIVEHAAMASRVKRINGLPYNAPFLLISRRWMNQRGGWKNVVKGSPIFRPARNYKGQRTFQLKAFAPISKKRGARTYLGPIIGTFTVLGVGLYTVDHFYSQIVSRSVRALYVFLWVAYQYYNVDKYQGNIRQLHETCATMLYEMLMANKGLYIKLGQAIANQGPLFPIEYQRKFSQLYDHAPVDDWQVIDKLLQSNLGPDYETKIFSSFQHEPIASASIAQVHRATLASSGDEVVVKVQHPYIQHQIGADLWVYRIVTKVYEKVFDIPMSFFAKYVADHMVKETNFVNEQLNAQRLAQYMRQDPDLDLVVVPRMYPQFSTSQILVIEWIEGISLSEKQKLIDAKYDVKKLVNLYLKSFGRQMFKYGFVHSDPHPGNLIARKVAGSPSKEQLVILDHGLYIELSSDFTQQYAKLWEKIFLFDSKKIEKIASEWGIKSTDLFATLVQLKPFQIGTKNRKSQDVNELLKEFLDDREKFPKQLIFLLRTMRMMQTMNQQFGSPVNRIGLLTRESVKVLSHRSILDYIKLIPIRILLFFNDLTFSLVRIKQYWLSDKYGWQSAGIEDYLEQYMKNTAKSIGMEWVEQEDHTI